MAINQRNDDKGRSGGPMPIQSPNDGAHPMSRRSPGMDWKGGRAAAGGEVPQNRPSTSVTPCGNPSNTPRAGR